MHRTTRMLGILMALQAGPQTLGTLSHRFACSTKTIQRDLAALSELQIPVRTAQGFGGGISLDDSWWLGAPNLSHDELETLIIALEHAPRSDARGRLVEKLRGSIRPGRFDVVVDDPTRPVVQSTSGAIDDAMVELIRKAMLRRTWLRVDYSGSTRSGERRVFPERVFIADSRWYVEVIDERSRELRRFRIDRIVTAIPCLAPDDAEQIRTAAENHPDYEDPGHPLVQVDLTARGEQFCKDDVHFRSHVHDGRLEFRCPPSDIGHIANELLRMVPECRVVAPPELIDAMRARVTLLQKHLDD